MRLKDYQLKVLNNLCSFIEHASHSDLKTAYRRVWEANNVLVGEGHFLKEYQNDKLVDIPNVCLKVPTGGGKTFLACAAIKPILGSLTNHPINAVVWLVPSESIMTQTLENLQNIHHDYRRKIDNDFRGKVQVYSKEDALLGKGFNAVAVQGQLSIFVLSYDSFRRKNKNGTDNKDGLRAYRQNGYLGSFKDNSLFNGYKVRYQEDEGEYCLSAILRSFNPVVVVDESHHADTQLSIEMLKNFNPSFVLELTATPKDSSNIISIVTAAELKREHMVKLPVLLVNRQDKKQVLNSAIDMQRKLEKYANEEERYIRPIVLVQAESRSAEENTTFDKIKEYLQRKGIPKEQIAIKTAEVNELKDVKLMDENCPIRYIITVNALKEGWDCPFAYILATVANRNSVVDVEQIIGRVLRLPYTVEHNSQFLNMSYVITSSADFSQTAEQVAKGLNSAGFSKKEFRVANYSEPSRVHFMDNLFASQNVESSSAENESEEDDLLTYEETDNTQEENEGSDSIDNLFEELGKQGNDYNTELEASENISNNVPPECEEDSCIVSIRPEFAEEITQQVRLPRLYFADSYFDTDTLSAFNGKTLVTKNEIGKDFELARQSTEFEFQINRGDMFYMDIDPNTDEPQRRSLSRADRELFHKIFINLKTIEAKKEQLQKKLVNDLNENDAWEYKDIKKYVQNLFNARSDEEILEYGENYDALYSSVNKKIKEMYDDYCQRHFFELLNSHKIVAEFDFQFSNKMRLAKHSGSIAKSLYTGYKDNMNIELETPFVEGLAGLENVKWWHRNLSRNEENAYGMNGFTGHYPDFIVMTQKGTLICVETKGDYLANSEQFIKAKMAREIRNACHSGRFEYFMVFRHLEGEHDGCLTMERFFEIMENL